MSKLINCCLSCEESFSDKFKFCPNCAGKLQSFRMTPLLQPRDDNASPEIEIPTVAQKTSDQHSLPSSDHESKSTYLKRFKNSPVNDDFNDLGQETAAANQHSVQATDSDKWYLSGPDELAKDYGGIGRLAYAGWMFLLGFIHAMVARPSYLPNDDDEFRIFPLIVVGLAVWLVVLRLKNIGESGWLGLLALIPGVNLWIGYKCLTQQEGYLETKELDGPGKIVRLIFILFLAFLGVGLLMALLG